jgi:hypothetical protein
MAGYSGTPLAKKLGIKPQFRVAFFELPAEVRSELKEAIASCTPTQNGKLDFAVIFAQSQAELRKEFVRFAGRLAPAGILWVSWPKKSSGVPTDLDENRVRQIGLDRGLVDVKVCAVNDIWSGLKFVIRLKDRSATVARAPSPVKA